MINITYKINLRNNVICCDFCLNGLSKGPKETHCYLRYLYDIFYIIGLFIFNSFLNYCSLLSSLLSAQLITHYCLHDKHRGGLRGHNFAYYWALFFIFRTCISFLSYKFEWWQNSNIYIYIQFCSWKCKICGYMICFWCMTYVIFSW